MKHFILYLINSAITLSILYAIYYLLLRQLTFYRANRWLLLCGIAFSLVLPLIKMPILTEKIGLNMLFLDAVFVSPNAITQPSLAQSSFNIWQVLFYAYLLMSCVLLFRFAWQLLSLAVLAYKSKVQKQGDLRFYQHSSINMPFTFFKNIFLGKDTVSSQIVDHELTHARQLHSVDSLLAELYAIVFWFNPLSWRYKNELTLNLEYLADEGALQYGHAQQNYQLQLLKASICDAHYALANHFAQTIIKKRIKMMNTNPSPKNKQWRYVMFIPALATAFIVSNCQKTVEKVMPVEVEISQSPVNGSNSETPSPTNRQGTTIAVEVEKLYNFASIDKKPIFPGGNDKIMRYMAKHFQYPDEAKQKNVQGIVLVKFIIEESGKITNVKAVRGQDLGAGLAEEAERVVKAMPQWSPGMKDGKAVRVAYTVPIVCMLQSTKTKTTSRVTALSNKNSGI